MPPPSDRAFWDRFERNVRLGIAKEKVDIRRQMRENAAIEAATPRKTVDGLGQREAVIPARLYFRWMEEDRYFWADKKNVQRFLQDNPELRAARPEKKYF